MEHISGEAVIIKSAFAKHGIQISFEEALAKYEDFKAPLDDSLDAVFKRYQFRPFPDCVKDVPY
jgi:hypothetical protein